MNKFLVGTNEQGRKVAIITHQHQSFGVDNFQDKFHIPEISSHGIMDVNDKGIIVIDKCSAIYNPNDGVFIEGLFRKGLMFRSELSVIWYRTILFCAILSFCHSLKILL